MLNARPTRFRLVLLVTVSIVAGACGRAVDSGLSNPSPTGAASPSPSPSAFPSPPSSPPTGWQTYTDDTYAFTIYYPPGFVVDNPGSSSLPAPWLRERRVVEKKYENASPLGQIDIGVYTKDADTPEAWVQEHTGPCGSPVSKAYFWDKVLNLTSSTAAGRNAASFDWDMGSCGPALTVHETVFLMGTSYVIRFDWWSTDANYGTTLQQDAQQILASFRGQ